VGSRLAPLISNLALVYFLEYTITTAFTIQSTRNIVNATKVVEGESSSGELSYVLENAFVIFNFCYQAGVFISRSSLSFVQIERIWMLTAAQAVLFAFFLANSLLFLCSNIYLLFSLMVLVGLMGGASYVNVL